MRRTSSSNRGSDWILSHVGSIRIVVTKPEPIDRLAEPRESLMFVAKKRVSWGNPKSIVISSGRVLSNLNYRLQRRVETPTSVALPYCACLLCPAFQFELLL